MTKPKSEQKTPHVSNCLRNFPPIPPLVIKNRQSKKKLRSLIEAAFAQGDLSLGITGTEHRLLVAANQARIVYYTARNLSQVKEKLKYLEDHLPKVLDTIQRVHTNNLILDQHWKTTLDELQKSSPADKELDLTAEQVAELEKRGCSVFNPGMIESFPLESTQYGLELTLDAVRNQLSQLNKDYKSVSLSDRPETEVIAHTIREIHKDLFPDKPNYIGSQGGPMDNLYQFLCEIAGYEPGCGISTLRKPYSFVELEKGKRFSPLRRTYGTESEENGES